MDTNTMQVTGEIVLDQIDELDRKLHLALWDLVKVSLAFNKEIRMKLIDLSSDGDENFLRQSYLFICRTTLLTDLEKRLESLQAHPIHDAMHQSNKLLRRFGLAGIDLNVLPEIDYQAPETFAGNTAFTDEVDRTVDQACNYIEQINTHAEALREQLTALERSLRTQA